MTENINEIEKLENQDKVQQILDNLTLFDDDLMSRVFDHNIPATELFLSIVLERHFQVISVVGQDELKNPEVGGRNITLDVHAVDENGRHIDIEVQGNSKGAHVKRARFHSSVVDSRMLKERQDFRELEDSYVIFMYKRDKFGEGLPIYHLERFIKETMKPVNDGSHIIYANGKYKGDDPIGWLISDFHQKKSENIHYKELADGVRHFKETEEGREIMCESVERYGDRRAEQANLNAVRKLMSELKMTLDQALDFLSLDNEQRASITKRLQK